jgi:hypothetical protein
VLNALDDSFLKIEKPWIFQHPRLWRSDISKDQSMGAPRLRIMGIMLSACNMVELFFVISIPSDYVTL